MSKIKNVPKIINGDTVIGFANSQTVKDMQWMDVASLSAWYQDDPNKNHLGLIELFTNMAQIKLPFYEGMFKKGAVIEVNGINGKFTYDLPVFKSSGMFTVGDTSNYSATPGNDDTVFPIKLDRPLANGDVITYDAQRGEQAVVSEDHPIEQEGDSWVHWCKIPSFSGYAFYPADKLKAGIEYFKVGHVLGEYSEQFSSISTPNNVGTLKCEFQLGNHRGVESYYTMYADTKRMNGAAVSSKDFLERFMNEQDKLGTDKLGRPNDMFFTGKLTKDRKNIVKSSMRIGSVLEYLVLTELMKIEAHQLYFQRGGIIRDINGTKRLNEGIMHQYRRGRIFKYSRPGGVTFNKIKQIMTYVFRGRPDLKPYERVLKLDCGYMMYLNLLTLFKQEALSQLDALSPLLGTDRVLPKSPVSGSNLRDLTIDTVLFTKVNVPGLGMLEIRHDPSLDYTPMADRNSAGFYGDGYSRDSYTAIVRDAASSEYSNARTNLPSGTKLVNPNALRENVFYVKPEGENLYWGYSNGRYAHDKASDIISTHKRMGVEIWAHSASAGWVKDITGTVILELED